MKDHAKIILELNERLKELTDASAHAAGELSSLTKLLKIEYGVTTIAEALTLLENMKNDRDEILAKLELSIEEVNEVLDGYDNED